MSFFGEVDFLAVILGFAGADFEGTVGGSGAVCLGGLGLGLNALLRGV